MESTKYIAQPNLLELNPNLLEITLSINVLHDLKKTPRTLSQRGAWVAQSVERPTSDFGWGHHHTVHESEPHIGLRTDSVEPAWDSLRSPSTCALSPSQNK